MKRFFLKLLPLLLLVGLLSLFVVGCGDNEAENPNGGDHSGQTTPGGNQGENPGGSQGENPGGENPGGTTAHTHTMTKHERKEPTCKADGNVEYYSCSGCNKNFSDEAGTTEVSDVVLKADESAHVWGDWTFLEGSCNKNGTREHTCTVCGKTETEKFIAKGHDWTEWQGGTATCTEDGNQTRSCKVCHTEEVNKVSALGHDWSDWKMTTEPTCDTAGKRERTCSVCSKKVEEDVKPLGHEFTFKTTKEATQDAEGSETGTCSVCGDTLDRVIPKKDVEKGVYRIVVSKTNGRYIPMWHKAKADGKYWRWDRDGVTVQRDIYTTEVTITKPDGEFVFRGNMIVRDEAQKEIPPYIEVELPLGDYKITLGEIPDGYIYRDSYDLKKDEYIRISPVKETGSDKTEQNTRFTKDTPVTNAVDVYGNKVEASDRKLAGSIEIILTSQMSDGRLPAKSEYSVDGNKGGLFKGAVIPDFTLTDVDGNTVRLKDLLAEKKIVILDVYFILCPHCMNIAPGLVEFATHYKDDVAVICLNRDDTNVNYAKQMYDPNGHYKYPEWFYCILDYKTQFYFNIENSGEVTAPTEVVIDDGFCVADVLPTEHPITDIFRNLPDGMNRDYYKEIEEMDKKAAANTVQPLEFVLPERKELFA